MLQAGFLDLKDDSRFQREQSKIKLFLTKIDKIALCIRVDTLLIVGNWSRPLSDKIRVMLYHSPNSLRYGRQVNFHGKKGHIRFH